MYSPVKQAELRSRILEVLGWNVGRAPPLHYYLCSRSLFGTMTDSEPMNSWVKYKIIRLTGWKVLSKCNLFNVAKIFHKSKLAALRQPATPAHCSGEVRIDLSHSPLDEEAEWHYLTTYTGDNPPSHLPSRYTPPHTASRYSESPGSDFEDGYSLYKDRLEQDGFYHRERGGSRRSWRSSSPGARRGPELSPQHSHR